MAAIFAVVLTALILSVGGLASLSVVAANIENIFSEQKIKDAAMIAFLVTASGVSFFGFGSAFWGLMVGFLVDRLQAIRSLRS